MIRIDGVLCELCGICVGVCPADAVIIEGTVIRVDAERCIECLACVLICPVGASSSGNNPSTSDLRSAGGKEHAHGNL